MARIGSLALVLAVSGLVAACDRAGPPAPFELHTHPGQATFSEPPPAIHPDHIAVASGDTLYAVSRRYGVPVRAIIDANDLKPPYRLRAGARLALPQVRTHLVRPGETLDSVARAYGVEASTLAGTNHLAPPYIIRSGETLVLPASVTPIASVAPAPPSPHVAPRPGTTAAAAPPVAAPALMPGEAAPPSAAPPPAAAAPQPPPALAPPPPAAPEPAAPKPAERTTALPPLPGKGFLWPVRGRVIAGFGTTAQGTHNDGINIAAPEGTPVLAADAGEVAYAGNELRGYGNLVLIKHANGYITAYGHNEVLLVKRGQHVARGQPIAKVGATGAVTEPQLHFEIRRGTRVLDPDEYLPSQTATAQ